MKFLNFRKSIVILMKIILNDDEELELDVSRCGEGFKKYCLLFLICR